MNIKIPEAFSSLVNVNSRYKTYYGGRGAAKSHSIARVLLLMGAERKLRIACAREVMTSIGDSVHRLMSDVIAEYGLESHYTVQKDKIIGANGTLILFKGLKHNVSGIKSLEGVDICWVEEAENVTDHSWEILIPTVRKEGSEIWVSFNTRYTSDPTYQRFVALETPDNHCQKVSWRDNPFFPAVLDAERRKLKDTDPEAYEHVWEGMPDTRRTGFIYAKQISQARDEKRIGNFPYDPGFPVYTGWDLGFGDSTSIWFFQLIGRGVRFIDHYANCGEQLEFYINDILNKKPYNYHRTSVYLPHDGSHGNVRGPRPSDQLRNMGYNNIVLPRRSNNLMAEIELSRQVMQYAEFNLATCAEGIHSLEHYKYEWDANRMVFKKSPLHDWASDDADSFSACTMAVDQLKHVKFKGKSGEKRKNPFSTYNGASSWMGA